MDSSAIGIAGTYMGMQQARLQVEVNTSVLRKTLDQELLSAQKLLDVMPAPNPPYLGNIIDQSV